ncbi:MAG: hypothetical protein JWP49_2677 [Phenylobacterium sp.]|jgi:hypothetical protein|nr:hypothetical protein [Phenylobacterium sp.]
MTISLKTLGFAAVVGLGLAGAAAAADAPKGGRPLTAAMTGANETPAADPKATGTASIRVNVGQNQVCWELTAKDLSAPAVAAHIHKGAKGASGPPVVPLTPTDATGKSAGCATVDAAVAKDLIQDPDDYYVNIHTKAFPGGAIRGQLGK